MAAAPTTPTVMPAMAREESWVLGGDGGGVAEEVMLGTVGEPEDEDGDEEEEELNVAKGLICVGGAVDVVVEVEV